MAQDNRGGYRPTAPQNNFGVSATGGAGNSGKQPVRVAPGGLYGQRTASVQQQQGAPMASDSMPQMPLPTVHPLTGATGSAGNPITHGVDFGAGGGSDVLPGGSSSDTRTQENTQIVAQYGPALVDAMKAPNVPDSYKRFVNSLLGNA